MHSINPKEHDLRTVHSYLLSSVGPRPIAFASTIDKEGKVNLSPFSFFNVFSANPPVMIFSPARSGRTGKTKHSHQNIKEIPEVVINIVNREMVEQMSLASSEYPKGVDEFIKSGFTALESEKVKPPRVAESPAQFECSVKDVIELGDQGGAGNLIICEVLMMHFNENVLDSDGKIDIHKIDLVGRMSGNYYVHANHDALFEVAKPNPKELGIGVDRIPTNVLNSKILSSNDFGILGSVESLPSQEEVDEMKSHPEIKLLLMSVTDKQNLIHELHEIAHRMIGNKKVKEAWKVLLIGENL